MFIFFLYIVIANKVVDKTPNARKITLNDGYSGILVAVKFGARSACDHLENQSIAPTRSLIRVLINPIRTVHIEEARAVVNDSHTCFSSGVQKVGYERRKAIVAR